MLPGLMVSMLELLGGKLMELDTETVLKQEELMALMKPVLELLALELK
jgi:hypothetical protein